MPDNQNLLEIRDLHVSVEETEILKGIDLTVKLGEVHAIMGPNGSGKSTLANVIAGKPGYFVDSGEIFYKGSNIVSIEPDVRARSGIFLAFQYPVELPGVRTWQFLKSAVVRSVQLVSSAVSGPVGNNGYGRTQCHNQLLQ